MGALFSLAFLGEEVFLLAIGRTVGSGISVGVNWIGVRHFGLFSKAADGFVVFFVVVFFDVVGVFV